MVETTAMITIATHASASQNAASEKNGTAFHLRGACQRGSRLLGPSSGEVLAHPLGDGLRHLRPRLCPRAHGIDDRGLVTGTFERDGGSADGALAGGLGGRPEPPM